MALWSCSTPPFQAIAVRKSLYIPISTACVRLVTETLSGGDFQVEILNPTTKFMLDAHRRRSVREFKSKRRGSHLSNLAMQKAAINATCEFMGFDFWDYRANTGTRYKKRGELMNYIQEHSGWTVSYSALMKWIDYYQKYGEVPAQTQRHRKRRATIGQLRGGKNIVTTNFTESDKAKLSTIIQESPQLYLDEIQNLIEAQTGKHWDASTIWRKIQALGYSLKVAVFRAKQQDQMEVHAYFCRLKDRMSHPCQLIYIDETARGANASRRRRAYSPRGVTPVVEAPMVREFDKRYTLIGACNWDGFVTEACCIVEREHGSADTDPDRGTVDTERFEQYVEQHLVPVLGKSRDGDPNSIVVMDNASIHASDRIRDLIEDAGAKLVYTAPYSPELNPIEYMFGEYKKSLKRLSNQPGYDWMAVHQQSLWTVNPSMAKAFYRHCKVPMMEEWFEKQESSLERPDDFLPFPFNEAADALLDLLDL